MSIESCKSDYYRYYKERNHQACPKAAPPRSSKPKLSRDTSTHESLTRRGIPRRSGGGKLGLRRRRMMTVN